MSSFDADMLAVDRAAWRLLSARRSMRAPGLMTMLLAHDDSVLRAEDEARSLSGSLRLQIVSFDALADLIKG